MPKGKRKFLGGLLIAASKKHDGLRTVLVHWGQTQKTDLPPEFARMTKAADFRAGQCGWTILMPKPDAAMQRFQYLAAAAAKQSTGKADATWRDWVFSVFAKLNPAKQTWLSDGTLVPFDQKQLSAISRLNWFPNLPEIKAFEQALPAHWLQEIPDIFLASCRAIRTAAKATGERQGTKPPTDDGPFAPNDFRWNGKHYTGIPPKPFAAMAFLWEQPNRTAEKDELAKPIYRDSEELMPDNAMNSLRKGMNTFFRQYKIPFHAVVKAGYLSIKAGLPPPAKPKAKPKPRRRTAKKHAH
jgi:hypothetical protein